MSALVQLTRHVKQLRECSECPQMIGPVVTGVPVVSPVMLIGQAPGVKEGPMGRPFAWTAGKTLFQWFGSLGMSEDEFRTRVYMAAVCRCFPGKAESGGDRVPAPDEIAKCNRHLVHEVKIIRPQLVIPVGKLAISQLVEVDKLTEIIGVRRRAKIAGVEFDMIALPHPSGASTWHRTEPGKTLLVKALGMISVHPAWRSIMPAQPFDPAAVSP